MELFKETLDKNGNRFHPRKAAEADDAPRVQPGTVRLVSSISRPDRWAAHRMISSSCSARSSSSSFVQQYIVLSSEKEIPASLLMMQPRGRSQNRQHVAPMKAIDTNIRGVILSPRSSTQATLLTCGARGENRAHEFLHLLLHSRPLVCSCGFVRRCFLVPSSFRSPSSSARIPTLSVFRWARALRRSGMGVLHVGVM